MKIIVVAGPQGSGKGTISNKLVEEFRFKYLDVGASLREEIKKGTKIGKEIREMMKTGLLFPDNFINSYVENKLQAFKEGEVVIIDGYPRTPGQKIFLDKKFSVSVVLFFSIPEEVSIFRISGRRYCPKCGRIYNVNTEPKPKYDETCDVCGEKLIQREDDRPKAIKVRLKEFKEKTLPIINAYKEEGKVVEIDATPPIEEVYRKTKQILVKKGILSQ